MVVVARRSRLAARRRAREFTQESLAYHLRVARNTVGRWERGESDPEPWNRRPLADALQVSLDELDDLLRPDDVADTPAPIDPDAPGSPAAILRADARHLVGLSDRYGSDDVLPLALRLNNTARAQRGDDLAMLAAVAEAAEIAGWIAFDAGQPEQARRLNHEAIVTADLAGDSQLRIFTLANLAMVDVCHGRPAEAAAIADHVLDDHPAGKVAALFHLRAARAHAQAGDRRTALDALDRAEGKTGDGNGPWWAWWITPAEQAWHRGATLGDLGEWAPAVQAYQHSVAQSATDNRRRSVTNTLAALADAQQRAGDVTGLEVTLHELIGYRDVASGRTTALLWEVTARIARSRTSTPTVAELAHLLRADVT